MVDVRGALGSRGSAPVGAILLGLTASLASLGGREALGRVELLVSYREGEGVRAIGALEGLIRESGHGFLGSVWTVRVHTPE